MDSTRVSTTKKSVAVNEGRSNGSTSQGGQAAAPVPPDATAPELRAPAFDAAVGQTRECSSRKEV